MAALAVSTAVLFGQSKPAPTGTIRLIGQPSIDGATVKLNRKRFYLLRGDFKQNADLIERLKNAQTVSRSCFIRSIKASPQLACWFKNDKFDCESAFCRQITAADIDAVPEFKTAYQLTLKQVGGRKPLAAKWLTNNLSADIRGGFYRMQKAALKTLLGEARPVRNIMTDGINGTAYLTDIPLARADGDAPEVFTLSNIVPIEIGAKSYVWTCEAKVDAKKLLTLNLKSCKSFVKDLTLCAADGCQAEAKQ